MTCHAPQAELFKHTLMGRINQTQKGKFDCENCHGPGSAHVKAGGGRGVGGIISFRPDDPSRTAQENNAICLACHEQGDRTYWNGSTHETRGLMCSELPHHYETGVPQSPTEDCFHAGHLLPVPQEPPRRELFLIAHAVARRQDYLFAIAIIRTAAIRKIF